MNLAVIKIYLANIFYLSQHLLHYINIVHLLDQIHYQCQCIIHLCDFKL